MTEYNRTDLIDTRNFKSEIYEKVLHVVLLKVGKQHSVNYYFCFFIVNCLNKPISMIMN